MKKQMNWLTKFSPTRNAEHYTIQNIEWKSGQTKLSPSQATHGTISASGYLTKLDMTYLASQPSRKEP